MGLGLSLKIMNAETGEVRSQRIERPAVLIGRDSQMCDCVLVDTHVSKLHASLEIRDGQFFVRDASSTNGTVVRGQRIDPSTWTSLGPAAQDQEFAISKWRFSVHAEHVEERSGMLSVSLASIAGEGVQRSGLAQGTFAMSHPLDALAGVYADHIGHTTQFLAALKRTLEAAPPSAREFMAQEAATRFPLLLNNADIQALLTQHGAKILLTPERAALLAVQDLARAHVDAKRPPTTPREIAVFATNMTMALTALLGGTMQLFSGMREFESQMDIDTDQNAMPASRRPMTLEELGRSLLDWRERTEPALDVLRRRFAALMVHQVAMLNGVMRGVKVLLTELAPRTLEKMLQRGSGQGGKWRRFFGLFFRSRALWSLFSERYADLADEENERFRLLFGPEFATEYRQLASEAAGGRGPKRPGVTSSSAVEELIKPQPPG